MRLLYICLDPGVAIGGSKGAAIHVAEMRRALAEEGHTTSLVARSVAPGFDEPATLLPITRSRVARRLPFRSRADRAASQRIADAIDTAHEATRYDLVYERYSLGRREGIDASRRYGVPHVLEVNAPLAREASLFRGRPADPAAAALERDIWQATDLVAVPSSPMGDIVRVAGQPRVLVVPNAVDPAKFNADVPTGNRRAELGLTGRLVVGFAGTARPWHDLGTLVAAVAELPDALRASLLIIGQSPGQQLVDEAAARGVHLVVTGAVPHGDVPGYLSIVDVAVATLRADPELSYFSPLKALEYLAAGRATVVADTGDLRTLVERGAALSYRAGEPSSLARAIQRIAQDDGRRRDLAIAGKALANSWTWQAAARSVIDEICAAVPDLDRSDRHSDRLRRTISS